MEKNYNYTGYNPDLKRNAGMLRKNMTWYERKLWFSFLKDFKLKFYRQRVINAYIADFYCPMLPSTLCAPIFRNFNQIK